MLLACPYCGPRDVSEFTYQGDGNRTRPDPRSQDIEAWNAYIYDRINIAGDQHEIWQHSGGCRSHLRVVRNTLTHKIASVTDVRADEATAKPSKALRAADSRPEKSKAPGAKPRSTGKRSAK